MSEMKLKGSALFTHSLKEMKGLAKRYNMIPMCLEMYMEFQTPIAVLSRIKEAYDRYFRLVSIEGGEKIERYPFIRCNLKATLLV